LKARLTVDGSSCMAAKSPSDQLRLGSCSIRSSSATSGSRPPAWFSGRQRKQGRKPASRQAGMEGKNRVFSKRGFRAAQVSRQNTPVVLTPTKAWPS